MSLELERRARDLFLELCDLPEPDRRAALESRVQGDAELGRAVQELLDEDAAASQFLAVPALGEGFRVTGPYRASGMLPTASAGEFEQHPEVIGPYRILAVIGSGGMGIVYRAEQQRPRRVVALKVLRSGLLDARTRRYFEHEAQALARLKHPGTAQIHEAGTADFGRGPVPFLVMEFVDGVDVVQHAREHALDTHARVDLLVKICHAVHHAHQKGVFHRDIKPSNVLVTESGDPKVLDFGLAALADEEHSRSEDADARRIIGTLAYMSPERVHASPDAVDASSDIYSLGATAYELLSGYLPFDLSGQSLVAALSRVGREIPQPIQERAPQIDRDLAAIVHKAMARRQEQRYESAAALAEDLVRWQNHEVVLARRGSTVERFRKFARRERAFVIATGAIASALILGAITTTWQWLAARQQSSHAQRIQVYLQDTLRSAGEPRVNGAELPVSHVLARATGGLEAAFADHPRTLAELSDTLGMAYYEIGDYSRSEELVQSSLDWRTRELGPTAKETLASRNNLGIVLIALGRYQESEQHLRAALAGRRERLGAMHEDTQRTANWLGLVLLQGADPTEAGELFQDSLAVRRRTLGEKAAPTLATRQHLALVWRRQGRIAEAETALRDVLAIQRSVCGPDAFDPYETLNSLATLLLDAGRVAEADALLEEALEGYRRLRGPDHADTLLVAQNLNTVRSNSSVASLPPASSTSDAPATHPREYVLLIALAATKFYRGELAEAESDLRTAEAGLMRIGGQERYLGLARQSLAGVLLEQGQLDESVGLLRAVLVVHQDAGTARSQPALAARTTLAEGLRRMSLREEALAEASAAHDLLLETAGDSAVFSLSAKAELAAVLSDLGRLSEALDLSRRALQSAESRLKAPNAYTEIFRTRYGRVLTLLGHYQEAECELLTARHRLFPLHGPRGPSTVRAGEALTELYEAWGRTDDAARWRETISASIAMRAESPAELDGRGAGPSR